MSHTDGVARMLFGHVPSPPVPAADSSDYLAPEARARMEIDSQLAACGWMVQDYKHAAVAAAPTVTGPSSSSSWRAFGQSSIGLGHQPAQPPPRSVHATLRLIASSG